MVIFRQSSLSEMPASVVLENLRSPIPGLEDPIRREAFPTLQTPDHL